MRNRLALASQIAIFFTAATASGQHPTAPAFSSNPTAPYTLYLDFAGFTFTGQWGNQAGTANAPGTFGAFDGNPSSFSTAQQGYIKSVWTQIAEKYSPFNINVTTIDPAAVGLTDLQRQNFYDVQSQIMHTVVGESPSTFAPGAGGISFIGTTAGAQAGTNGYHTNFVMTDRFGGGTGSNPTNQRNIAEAAGHENGHGLGLYHQGDYTTANTQVNDYSTNNGASGANSVAPIMGVAYSSVRGVWRSGPAGGPGTPPVAQNDPKTIVGNPNMAGYFNDTIGTTPATATPIVVTGAGANNINFNLAKGVITPLSTTSPNPINDVNYKSGYFSFTTSGGSTTINVNAGRQAITAGVADPNPMLNASMQILNSTGSTVLQTVATPSLSETLTTNLAAGTYLLRVFSAGGSAANNNGGAWLNANFYDMGSYFVTGTIPVPEPASILAVCGIAGGAWSVWRRRRSSDPSLTA